MTPDILHCTLPLRQFGMSSLAQALWLETVELVNWSRFHPAHNITTSLTYLLPSRPYPIHLSQQSRVPWHYLLEHPLLLPLREHPPLPYGDTSQTPESYIALLITTIQNRLHQLRQSTQEYSRSADQPHPPSDLQLCVRNLYGKAR